MEYNSHNSIMETDCSEYNFAQISFGKHSVWRYELGTINGIPQFSRKDNYIDSIK